ncbi:MAG: hypothetical protein A2233_03010 [Candidatus Kerfeldbacteria bacterium RIFOXYA2_FULL_38_24]|uniref:Uncharacterized protein n=1 Tax=Candidatus Kerfeldbacteria bacterium RIFOXYB2_FULL_38_14 TaxID=1798547 RepID=A0A1G2BE45_9BACT|nr:MAG: hypothetical protein A2233_03010 [Candidatus Kerfeldbacteria bacterium RIFOXYA2_FULL_38_24]OGY86467.1 MAG: hypothetical protein A2319_03125 [Candidatus Kerfeldbacteria bacterium RIFOXYB2_FULL_38_14]
MEEKSIRVNEPVILDKEETEEERLNRERFEKGQFRLKMITELRPQKVAELRAEFFDRKVPEEYASIISAFPGFVASNGSSPLGGEYGLFYGKEENGDLLREKIKGATVMDLGCGQWDTSRKAITYFNPARYIGVDKEKYGMKRFGDRYPISIFIKEKNIE